MQGFSDEIINMMKNINAKLRKNLTEFYSEFSITPTQADVLTELFYNGERSFSDLCDILVISKSNLSNIITRLEKDGLVHKYVLDVDKRSVIIDLTMQSRSIVSDIMAKINGSYMTALEKTIDSDREIIKNGLDKLYEKLK